MNSPNTSESTVLQIRAVGHVPAHKNKKRIMRGRLITEPKIQKWMTNCVNSFVSQLKSKYPTCESETSMAACLQSSIASLPHDDNWKIIPSFCVSVKMVPKGEEGATIILEKISPQLGEN